VARLSDEARQLARACAVIGRCFSPDVIAGVMNRPLGELEGPLQELVEASILRPFDYVDEGYYDFRHQLLRDAIYGTVPPSQRRRYHAQVAEFGMSLEGAHLIHASRHFERAGLHGQAHRTALSAAQEASRISARHEAYELYRRAIDNMPRDLPVGEQAELFERYTDAAAAIEHNDESFEAAGRARELYLAAGRPIDAAGMLLAMSTLTARRGAPRAEASSFLERAEAEIGAIPESPDRTRLRSYLLAMQADDALLFHDLDAARTAAEAARTLAESLGDRETVLDTELTLARIDIVAGRIEDGLRDGLRAAREARDAGYESVGVTGYRNMAIMAARVLDAPAAELALGEGLRYADAIEQSHCRQMMATTAALLDWGGGRWDAADERARQELVDRGCRRGVIGSLDVIGLVAFGRGRLDEARRRLEDSLASGRRIGEVQFILTPLWGLAETDLLAGDADRAIVRCEEALDIALETGERALLIPFVVTGVRSFLGARRPEDAERWFRQGRDHLAGWDAAAAALASAEGLIRLAGGSPSAARELFERAGRGWEARGRTWEAAWARLDLAQCLLRSNRYGEAASVLVGVRATAEGLRSEPLLRRVEELAQIGRGRGSVEEPWRPLTAREFEVAKLIAEGLTNGEIAERLDIAPKTASSHVEHILAKLGVARRAEIAAWAAAIGRVDAPAGSGSGATLAATGPERDVDRAPRVVAVRR
jgi:DNA-binding CsgD family transcriptional regulator/tetratricopeptide (TPR) repeat protein